MGQLGQPATAAHDDDDGNSNDFGCNDNDFSCCGCQVIFGGNSTKNSVRKAANFDSISLEATLHDVLCTDRLKFER